MSKGRKRILIVATVAKTHIMQFHIPTLKLFKDMGWETAVAARNDYADPRDCRIPYCDQFYDIPFERIPFVPQNVECCKKLKEVIDRGDYQIIHCHTPVGGVLGRVAAREARKKGTRVLYTAHGFHFYRGAPLKNWLMYYPIEKVCASFVDAILTINREDYGFARKHFRKTRIFYLPGIGIDTEKYARPLGRDMAVRDSLGISAENNVILSVGELNDNKNHQTIIDALSGPKMKNIHYLIAGDGEKQTFLREYAAARNVGDRVHLLGYRHDIAALLHASDVFVFPSFREGLPVSVMEAMAAGVPIVASRIRGNVDLIEDGANGFLCAPQDADGFADKIRTLLDDPALAEKFRRNGLQKIKGFDMHIVTEQLRRIYCAITMSCEKG